MGQNFMARPDNISAGPFFLLQFWAWFGPIVTWMVIVIKESKNACLIPCCRFIPDSSDSSWHAAIRCLLSPVCAFSLYRRATHAWRVFLYDIVQSPDDTISRGRHSSDQYHVIDMNAMLVWWTVYTSFGWKFNRLSSRERILKIG